MADEDVSEIVKKYVSLSIEERRNLAKEFKFIASVLDREFLFQPMIFNEPLRIAVDSRVQSEAVQRALFRMGCGFHGGSYPLTQRFEDAGSELIGIHVSGKGVIGFSFVGDREFFATCGDRLVPAQTVIDAKDAAALMAAYAPRTEQKTA